MVAILYQLELNDIEFDRRVHVSYFFVISKEFLNLIISNPTSLTPVTVMVRSYLIPD